MTQYCKQCGNVCGLATVTCGKIPFCCFGCYRNASMGLQAPAKTPTEERIKDVGDRYNIFFDELCDLCAFLEWACDDNTHAQVVYFQEKPLGGMTN